MLSAEAVAKQLETHSYTKTETYKFSFGLAHKAGDGLKLTEEINRHFSRLFDVIESREKCLILLHLALQLLERLPQQIYATLSVIPQHLLLCHKLRLPLAQCA